MGVLMTAAVAGIAATTTSGSSTDLNPMGLLTATMLFSAASSALLPTDTGSRLLLLVLLLKGTLVLLGCCAVLCSVVCAGGGLSKWCMRVRFASRYPYRMCVCVCAGMQAAVNTPGVRRYNVRCVHSTPVLLRCCTLPMTAVSMWLRTTPVTCHTCCVGPHPSPATAIAACQRTSLYLPACTWHGMRPLIFTPSCDSTSILRGLLVCTHHSTGSTQRLCAHLE